MRLAPLNLANRQCDLWINSIWCDMKIKTVTRAAHARIFQADFARLIIISASFAGMRLPHVKYFVIGISSKFHLMSVKLLRRLYGIFLPPYTRRIQLWHVNFYGIYSFINSDGHGGRTVVAHNWKAAAIFSNLRANHIESLRADE